MSKLPARTPARPPSADPNGSRYWSAQDLQDELIRTFQICHECRMCVNYCGSFPLLFDAIDRDVDSGRAEGAETLTTETIVEVSDHCWQCKMCYIKCPYTQDEGARELLDFPRLMAREKAQRARRNGVPMVDRVLGEPQLLGALGGGVNAAPANFVNQHRLLRKVAEKVTGISAKFPLPPLRKQSFNSWFLRREPGDRAGEQGSVVLFHTCYGDHNFPEVPQAAVAVLEHNGYSVEVPTGMTCCGMPNLDGGDVEAARHKMEHNVTLLLPYVERGNKVVVVGPTCGYTIKKEWPQYLQSRSARQVADATVDLMEFLEGLLRDKKLNREFSRGLGTVIYHAACHLRAQKIAYPAARLLSRIPNTEVRIVERCSAVDGTWGMKARFFEEGARYAAKLKRAVMEQLDDDDNAIVVGDCNLAGLRIEHDTGCKVHHPIRALASAYGLEQLD